MRETPEEPRDLDAVDEEILREVERRGRVTPSELARRYGASKSMVWRRLKKLEYMGLVRSYRLGGVVIFEPAIPPSPQGLFRIGILRASEYPYILPLARMLRARYSRVEIEVYDEAFRLAADLARGRLHVAMVPAVTALLVHRASKGAVAIVGGGSRGGAGIVEGPGPTGHASTMASTMELCAVAERLPSPRTYASSGDEILRLVSEGKVRYGVVWEPYLSKAARMGFRVLECNVPVCCLLTAHRSVYDEAERLSRAMAEAVAEARRGGVDLGSYASLIRAEPELVKLSLKRYEFLEEPPIEGLQRAWDIIREAAMPESMLKTGVIMRGRGRSSF